MMNLYNTLYTGGLVMAIIFLIITIVLFVMLDIPKVFGELTGQNEKKAIKDMTRGNEYINSVVRKEQKSYYGHSRSEIKTKNTSSSKRTKDKQKTTENRNLGIQVDNASNNLGGKNTENAAGSVNSYANARQNVKEPETIILTSEYGVNEIAESEAMTDVLTAEELNIPEMSNVYDGIDSEISENNISKMGSFDGTQNGNGYMNGEYDDDPDGETTVLIRDNDQQTSRTVEHSGHTEILVLDTLIDDDTLENKVKVIYNIVVVNSAESIYK